MLLLKQFISGLKSIDKHTNSHMVCRLYAGRMAFLHFYEVLFTFLAEKGKFFFTIFSSEQFKNGLLSVSAPEKVLFWENNGRKVNNYRSLVYLFYLSPQIFYPSLNNKSTDRPVRNDVFTYFSAWLQKLRKALKKVFCK